MNLSRACGAVLITLVCLASLTRGQAFADQSQGPRQQVAAAGEFTGDTFFKQPMRGISVTHGEPRQLLAGSAVIESLSGTIRLPHGQHILKAQILNGNQDPVRGEVLATLDYVLVTVAPEGEYYRLTLRSPVRIPDLGAFGVLVLRDRTDGNTGDVAVMLNYLQPARP